MSGSNGHQVKMIPIDQINVLNPRSRGRAKFQQIVRNIEHLGLKKPICVALHPGQNGTPSYDLVCGQGRIEALQALGATEIPALVIEATKEEVLLMSLTENLARRSHTSVELVKRIVDLRDRHYSFAQIASKTDLELP